MKVTETHSEPDTNPNREPYRLRIEGSAGEVIEITECSAGGFTITAASFMGSRLVIWPTGANTVIVEVK